MIYLSRLLIVLGLALAAAAAGLGRWSGPALSKQASPAPEGHRPDHPDEAMRFRRLQMQDERKQIPADALLKAKAQVDTMRAAQMDRAVQAGKPEGLEVAKLQPADWVPLGPGNVGGRIRALVIDPRDGNKIWIGSVSGGIWRTTNAGESWTPVNDFMANLAVSTMVIDPINPNTMYVGTGESFAGDGLHGLGVFKSTDAGTTWAQLPSTNPADATICPTVGRDCAWSYVNRLAISPDGSTLLAGTLVGIRRSSDGGATWIQSAGDAVMDIDFHPTNSQQAVASGNGAALFSVDGGQNWAFAAFNPAITGRVESAYAPSSPNIVYASVNMNSGDIFRSTDGGQNFVRVHTGSNFLGTQGNYDNIVWVDPQDANTVIVGGIDLWRSTNAASANPITVTQISQWQCAPGQHGPCANTSAHADQHVIVAHPNYNRATNRTVYFGNDGGVFRANDVLSVGPTSGWTNLNRHLAITQFYSGAVTPGQVLIGGTQDNGNLRAVADSQFSPPYNPEGWTTPVGGEGDGGVVAVDPNDPAYLYAEYIQLQIKRSSDGGATMSRIYCHPNFIDPETRNCSAFGITDVNNGANFVAPFILDPTNADRMLAGGLSLWRSNNVKSALVPSWTAIKPPAPPSAPVPISAIAVSPKNTNLIVVGHNEGQIFMTSDGTAASPTWSAINAAPLPARFVTRLVFDDTRTPEWIYVTFGGFSPDNVYVSKDLGVTWTDITGTGATGLPDVPVRSLVINPAAADLIYVGTEVGVFASEDAGATWQLPQGGPANVSVDELFWSSGGNLMAATHGRGFFTTNKPVFKTTGAGTDCIFIAPCPPEYGCEAGDWDCPCTWGGGSVPTFQDDVAVRCANIRGGTRGVRNLRVNRRLSMADSNTEISVTNTLANYGTISGGNIVTKHLVNGETGIISTGRVWAREGDIYNAGTLLSSGEWGSGGGAVYPVQAQDITVNLGGWLSAVGLLVNGDVFVGENSELQALSGGPAVNPNSALFVHGDVFNDGLIDIRGEWAFSNSNNLGFTHTLTGSGEWRAGALTFGSRADAQYGSGANFSLGSSVVFTVVGLSNYWIWDPKSALLIGSNATIRQNGFTLTINSPAMLSYGQFNLGTGALNFNVPYLKTQSVVNPGRYPQLGPPGFLGTGNVNFITPGNPYLEISSDTFQPAFRVTAGTVDGAISTTVERLVTIDAGATLNLNRGGFRIDGDLLVNGTIGKTSPPTTRSRLSLFGSTITNNGSISADILEFNHSFGAVPRTYTLTGTGAWPAATIVRVGYPDAATTVTLANDMTLNWSTLSIWETSRVNTGHFTLSMPCSSGFDTSNNNLTGEIIGGVRRTGIADCAGAIPLNSRYTTVQFTGGTRPAEVTAHLLGSPPFGFSNAVGRTYSLAASGGSGWTSTLRLGYRDSELNGNDEAALALYRQEEASWSQQGFSARDTTANWVERAGVTQFSLWTLSSAPPVFIDSDYDGMSDEFEQTYFGSPTGGDPAADNDGDGTTNLAEFRAGTSPTDAKSVFKIVSANKAAGGGFTISFPTVSGRYYDVEYTDSLDGEWSVLRADIPGSGANISITDYPAASEAARIYRVVVLP